jgi:hypothetical protein
MKSCPTRITIVRTHVTCFRILLGLEPDCCSAKDEILSAESLW